MKIFLQSILETIKTSSIKLNQLLPSSFQKKTRTIWSSKWYFQSTTHSDFPSDLDIKSHSLAHIYSNTHVNKRDLSTILCRTFAIELNQLLPNSLQRITRNMTLKEDNTLWTFSPPCFTEPKVFIQLSKCKIMNLSKTSQNPVCNLFLNICDWTQSHVFQTVAKVPTGFFPWEAHQYDTVAKHINISIHRTHTHKFRCACLLLVVPQLNYNFKL